MRSILTQTQILNICKDRSNRESPSEANRRVLSESVPMDGSCAVYHIPHSDTESVLTSDFECEGFSLIPTSANGNPIARYAQYWNTKRRAVNWNYERHWRKARGIQLFMGQTSVREIDDVLYYPICWDFEVELLTEHPEIFEKTLDWAYAIPNASLLITKSGGFRVNAWVSFFRPKNRQMVARSEWKNAETGKKDGVTYAEILSEKGLARIDTRYMQVVGDIAVWPQLTEDVFLQPLEWISPLDARIRGQRSDAVSEEELTADLPADLAWKQGDLLLISQRRYDCEIAHGSNPAVEFRKHPNGKIDRVCHACSEKKVVRRGKAHATPTEAEKIEAVRAGGDPLQLHRPPQKLFKKEEDIELATIEDNRARIERAVRQTALATLIKAGTGEGKGESMVQLAESGTRMLICVSTQEVADETAERLEAEGLNVLRWKAPSYGFTDEVRELPIEERIPAGAMCAIADLYNVYQQCGGNPQSKMCPGCPVLNSCQKSGLRAQGKKLLDADAIVICFPQLTTNPAFANAANSFLKLPDELDRDADGQLVAKHGKTGKPVPDEDGNPVNECQKKYRTVIIDDASLPKLFSECFLTQKQLADWRDTWEDTPLGEFAQEVLYALAQKDFIRILRRIVETISEDTDATEDIAKQMCALRYPAVFKPLSNDDHRIAFKGYMHIAETETDIPVARDWSVYEQYKDDNVPILKPDADQRTYLDFRNLDDAVAFGIFDVNSSDDIMKMPTLPSNANWTPWHALKTFFDEYRHDTMLPMDYDTRSGTLTWSVHPKLHEKAERTIIMGASLDIQLTKMALRAYEGDIYTEETPPTKHADGSKFLQIHTGAYIRRSLLEKDKDSGEYTGFSRTGKQLFVLIVQEMEANPDKRYGIVTFKWIVDAFKEEWQKRFPQLVYCENFHRAEGTNPVIDVLFVVGTPEVPDSAVEKKGKLIFGGTEFATQPLDTTRSDRFLNDGCPHSDWRMQVAWRSAVLEIVNQAIGRARLNLYPRTVVAITGIRIPTLTNREDTVLFDIQDWTIAGTLDRLPDEAARTATAREAQKQRQNEIDQRLENGESQRSIANTEGITYWDVRKVASARCSSTVLLARRAKATLVDKVQDYINKHPDGHTTRSIINTFSDYHPSSVKNALTELVASDKVIKVMRGMYCATPEILPPPVLPQHDLIVDGVVIGDEMLIDLELPPVPPQEDLIINEIVGGNEIAIDASLPPDPPQDRLIVGGLLLDESLQLKAVDTAMKVAPQFANNERIEYTKDYREKFRTVHAKLQEMSRQCATPGIITLKDLESHDAYLYACFAEYYKNLSYPDTRLVFYDVKALMPQYLRSDNVYY